jgi:hypothetical protein
MEDDNPTAMESADCSVDDLLGNLTPDQRQSIRTRVLEGIAEIECGEFTEYVGREGLKQLADGIKARGRARMLSAKTEGN